MATSAENTTQAHGQAAYKAIRKHFPSLMKVVATGDIVDHLYAEEVIEQSTHEVVTDAGNALSTKQKGNKVLKDVQVSVESKSEAFQIFCGVLQSEGQEELSHLLQGRKCDLSSN